MAHRGLTLPAWPASSNTTVFVILLIGVLALTLRLIFVNEIIFQNTAEKISGRSTRTVLAIFTSPITWCTRVAMHYQSLSPENGRLSALPATLPFAPFLNGSGWRRQGSCSLKLLLALVFPSLQTSL